MLSVRVADATTRRGKERASHKKDELAGAVLAGRTINLSRKRSVWTLTPKLTAAQDAGGTGLHSAS
jgi:hypothetical protein